MCIMKKGKKKKKEKEKKKKEIIDIKASCNLKRKEKYIHIKRLVLFSRGGVVSSKTWPLRVHSYDVGTTRPKGSASSSHTCLLIWEAKMELFGYLWTFDRSKASLNSLAYFLHMVSQPLE